MRWAAKARASSALGSHLARAAAISCDEMAQGLGGRGKAVKATGQACECRITPLPDLSDNIADRQVHIHRHFTFHRRRSRKAAFKTFSDVLRRTAS